VGFTGITALSNGNYVVASRGWNNGTISSAGAVTWGDGITGITGVVSSSNSLVGSHANDKVGSAGIKALRNGDYAVLSPNWANGAITRAGAITLGLGFAGVKGAIDSGNSLVGTQANDAMGNGQFLNLANGSILVASPDYRANQGRVDILWHGQSTPLLYTLDPGAHYQLNTGLLAALLGTGAQVTLQANTDIRLRDALDVVAAAGKGGNLTLQAGRSIQLDADLRTGNGDLTLVANDTAASGVVDAHRDAGAGHITQAAGTTIDAGSGTVNLQVRDGQGIGNAEAGVITLSKVLAGDLQIDSQSLAATLTAQNKVYDGNEVAAATAHVTGLVFHADSNLRLAPMAARFSDKNAGQNKAVTVGALQVTGFNGQQTSTLHSDGQVLTPTATASITPRALDFTATKQADGSSRFDASQISLGNVVQGDQVLLSGSADVASPNAGRYKAFAVNALQLSNGNYSVYGGQVQVTILGQPLLPGPAWSVSELLQQEERDLSAPQQVAMDLTVLGAKAPAQQLQQLN
jgi:hypothetical protein